MNRLQALERTRKLLAMADPAGGATENERRVAKAKADLLIERFDLRSEPYAAAPEREAPRPTWHVKPNGAVDLPWAEFLRTGKMNDPRVSVERYNSRSDWKVWIDMG